MASVQKTYADALFSLLEEENASDDAFNATLNQLEVVCNSINEVPDFVKFLNTPTIPKHEKLKLIETVFASNTTEYVLNFLKLIASKGRMAYFPQIYKTFRGLYNDRFKIAEMTVTSSMPLDDTLKGKIIEKMAAITGKTVSLIEKVDKSVIGGVVIDYGNTRYDGSVKTRLSELKKEISGIIA